MAAPALAVVPNDVSNGLGHIIVTWLVMGQSQNYKENGGN
jgi:hypothetical protein